MRDGEVSDCKNGHGSNDTPINCPLIFPNTFELLALQNPRLLEAGKAGWSGLGMFLVVIWVPYVITSSFDSALPSQFDAKLRMKPKSKFINSRSFSKIGGAPFIEFRIKLWTKSR